MTKGGILISDFDGTMTRRDFFRVALERLPASCGRWWERYEEGEISHFDALASIFAALRCSSTEMEEMIGAMGVEPGLRESCDRLEAEGWRLLVASAGCGWYIERIFASAGIHPELHTNPGTFREGGGLEMRRPTESPFFDPETGISKSAIVRQTAAKADRVGYAGDGRPDLAPALLAAPRFRFARGWLAEELRRRGEPFVPFERWRDIADHLTREAAAT